MNVSISESFCKLNESQQNISSKRKHQVNISRESKPNTKKPRKISLAEKERIKEIKKNKGEKKRKKNNKDSVLNLIKVKKSE